MIVKSVLTKRSTFHRPSRLCVRDDGWDPAIVRYEAVASGEAITIARIHIDIMITNTWKRRARNDICKMNE